MKILLVSFDKGLVDQLKERLSNYEVIDVRNGDEAINLVDTKVDFVVYDAISGSISEEDINQLYTKKFKDSHYIVLVDDLFPIDPKNLLVTKKTLIKRDEALEKVPHVIEGGYVPEEINLPKYEVEGRSSLELKPQEEHILEESQLKEYVIESTFPSEPKQLESHVEQTQKENKKVLIVSFDSNIINFFSERLGNTAQIIVAKNVREAREKVHDADVVVFDTISGAVAQRTLTEFSKNPVLSKKPYVLLLDELFAIDVDSIDLQHKYTYSRERELTNALQKVEELLVEKKDISKDLIELLLEMTQKEKLVHHEEEVPSELPAVSQVVEQVPEVEKIFEKAPISESIPEITQKEESFYHTEEKPVAEHILTPPVHQASAYQTEYIEKFVKEDVPRLIEEAIKNTITEDLMKSVINQVLSEKVEKVLMEEVSKIMNTLDIASIIREEASKALRERLRELIS
ncbi:response regulator transcription factor [Thermocrinis minervae]|uniref:DNA-binding response regulator, OmpR family, contains REC and winged-helix (WHTH) domain n=1 Tax=Thermocrinis minervae TaxID=381751 RepID=A0A1M6QZP3_9AQUI|nr:response regulator transcription factor [Thermocrinis minervae]SHK25620.1 DNA-binding response regulator, OmpR family, contains REC and winged-helix (wHTH) domain [Thermocrinis minervae]